jgi:hypothetical protein
VTTQPAPLPHQTSDGPRSIAEWRRLLATAPRGTDSKGRQTIQVCTASDGRGVFATVAYAKAMSNSYSVLRAEGQATKARAQ